MYTTENHKKPQNTAKNHRTPQNTTEYNQYKIYEESLQEFWNWGKEIAHYTPRNNAENSGFAIIASKSIYFLQALPYLKLLKHEKNYVER